MLVLAQLSSTNTSRSGSRLICSSNQADRRLRTSGRSCSAACAVFFARQPTPAEEAPQRTVTEVQAVTGEFAPQFFHRHVATCLEDTQDRIGVRFDGTTAAITAQRSRPQIA